MLIMGGVSAFSTAKPLVDEAIATIIIICSGASMLFYRAALPLSSQTLAYTRRDHPPPPQGDRLTLAQAQPREAGPARAGLPAQR
jgi:hypothetical protein